MGLAKANPFLLIRKVRNKMETMVSIIIPTYNRENVIKRAVNSVLRQSYSAYEVIIVDDGSTDGTEAVVASIEDPRIRYIALKENQGVAHARNVGIREARYEYIAFLDSDDEWLPNKLKRQMKKMQAVPNEFAMVYCRMSGLMRNRTDRFVCPQRDYVKEILEGNLFQPLLFQNVIGTPTIVVRKECLEQVGGFKEALRCLEDWELILRIAKRWKIGFVDEILVEVHKSAGSVSMNTGWYLVTRCYMVSLYRQEITELGMMDRVKTEILDVARKNNLYDETKELLSREIEL